jgi:plastocyanin
MPRLVATLSAALVVIGSAACSDNPADKKPSSSTRCSKDRAVAATRSFVGEKGFSPSCVKTKVGTAFVIGNVDTKAHSISSSTDAPLPITAELPRKNSLFSVKLSKAGTYHVTASGGGQGLTIFVS